MAHESFTDFHPFCSFLGDCAMWQYIRAGKMRF
jgi:hypothetical protein